MNWPATTAATQTAAFRPTTGRTAWRRRLLAIAGVLAAAAPAMAAPAPETTTIGGHTYRFPPDAFQGGIVETGRVGTILLELEWPSLDGWGLAGLFQPAGSETLLILANSGAPVDGNALPPERLAETWRTNIAIATADLGQPAFPLHPASTTAAHGPVPGDAMQQVQADAGPGSDPDVFVAPSLEAPTEIIGCTVAQADVLARCSQRFTERNLLMKASYPRALVVHWRAIHVALADYLAKHEADR